MKLPMDVPARLLLVAPANDVDLRSPARVVWPLAVLRACGPDDGVDEFDDAPPTQPNIRPRSLAAR